MSIAWGLKYFGTATTVLNVMDYQQETFEDGQESVRERVPVDVVESSAANLDAKMTLLHSLAYAVADYQRTKVANQPVYFTATVDTVLWRSEILWMKITNASGAAFKDEHGTFHRNVVIEMMRRPWETDTLYAATLYNENAAAGAAETVIYSGHDLSGTAAPTLRTNACWVFPHATAPAMNMATPAIINLYAAPAETKMTEFYITSKSRCLWPTALGQFKTNLLQDAGVAVDTTCSNDDYNAVTFTGTGAYNHATAKTLPDTEFQENKYYKPVVRFRDAIAYTDVYARIAVYADDARSKLISPTYSAWQLLTSGRNLFIFDAMKLPPENAFDQSYFTVRNLYFSIEFKSASVSARTVNVDFLQFIGGDGYLEVVKLANKVDTAGVTSTDSALIDCSTNPFTSIVDPNAGAAITDGVGSIWASLKGPGISIFPFITAGLDYFTTVLFFHFVRSTGLSFPDDSVKVSVKYRPRRRAI